MVRTNTHYDYVWFLTDEAAVRTDTDPVNQLVEILERNPKMAVLCPADPTGDHPGSAPTPKREWHAVTDTAHVGFMIRTRAIDEVGFLNPNLRYGVGAMVEYAYKLYSNGWFVAYADCVRTHQPIVLSAAPGKAAENIEQTSDRFAFDYMFSNYGWNWPSHFLQATAAHDISVDGFAYSHQKWAQAFGEEELEIRRAAVADEAPLLVGPAQKAPAETPSVEGNTEVSIHSDARIKLLVWPKYDSAEDLEVMVGEYGRLLLNREDVCLCVRHDPDRDIEINAACAAMALAHERILGPDVDLHILLVNDKIPPASWSTLGKAVDASLMLPSSKTDPERAAFHRALEVKVYEDVSALRLAISAPSRIPSLEDLFPEMEQLAG
jgi:hypothetical protein